jgi:hypothetical protein
VTAKDLDAARARMRHARNVERERLRNLARQQLTAEGAVFDEDTVEARTKQLEREKLAAATRRGNLRRRALIEQGHRLEAAHARLLEQAEYLVDLLREIAPAACAHSWQDGSRCEACDMPHADSRVAA